MKIVVYVEGPSDRLSMETLLSPLLEKKRQQGAGIEFAWIGKGNGKGNILTKVPSRAVDILQNIPESIVIALPDLYPKNVSFPHETYEELVCGIRNGFLENMHRKRIDDARLLVRFKVFCFKHDLEALLLAAHESLLEELKPRQPESWGKWTLPVENQDHGLPPKRVIEELFTESGKMYRDTLDAPRILSRVDYSILAKRCPQCFKPFIDYLESL